MTRGLILRVPHASTLRKKGKKRRRTRVLFRPRFSEGHGCWRRREAREEEEEEEGDSKKARRVVLAALAFALTVGEKARTSRGPEPPQKNKKGATAASIADSLTLTRRTAEESEFLLFA